MKYKVEKLMLPNGVISIPFTLPRATKSRFTFAIGTIGNSFKMSSCALLYALER